MQENHLKQKQDKFAAGAKNMAGSEYVEEAAQWAESLVMREYEGPGQMERAMDRASQKTGIDRNVFWSLRYRKPSDLLTSVYFRLRTAYLAEIERQQRLYEHERKMANDINSCVVRSADFVAGRKEKER